MLDNPRLHTPSWERPDLPDGYAACLTCGEFMTEAQLTELCPKAVEAETETGHA